ncbi:hypothetical protein ACPCKL_16995 [Streptomyces cellulosae]
MELVIARNPEVGSSLPYLLRLPVGGQVLLFKVKDTWPRTASVYCHPVDLGQWPEESVSFFDVATDRVTVREAQRARPPGC